MKQIGDRTANVPDAEIDEAVNEAMHFVRSKIEASRSSAGHTPERRLGIGENQDQFQARSPE